LTKLHQIHYLKLPTESRNLSELLAVSTEEGQILFFDTNSGSSVKAPGDTQENTNIVPTIQALGRLGGPEEGIVGRIKDFEILKLTIGEVSRECLVAVAGSSDGTVRLWSLDAAQFAAKVESMNGDSKHDNSAEGLPQEIHPARHVGRLIGKYETGNRITCLKAFVMSEIRESTASAGNHENPMNDLGGDSPE
jgi:protein MAK11